MSWSQALKRKEPKDRSIAEELLVLQVSPLTVAETEWVEKLRDWYLKHGRLSERQRKILTDMLRRYR